MGKVITEGVGSFYQHYPKTACVVTAHARGKDNAMTAAWHTSLSGKPPLYGVAIAPKRFTYQLITESGEFGVNFLPFANAELIAAIGGSRGEELDKFLRFSIARDKPVKTVVPILKDAYAAYECRLVEDREYGDHRWLVGEIVATHIQKEAFAVDGTLNLGNINPTLYLGQELYSTVLADSVRSLDRKTYGQRYKEV